MVILLNGPLGIGKSTLGEALSEVLEACVMLNGDRLLAANPPPPDEVAYLHDVITLLVTHHLRHGYRHFVIDHIWRTPEALNDLRQRFRDIAPDMPFRCFLLMLSYEENLRRIERRQAARALDEREFELRTVVEERELLARLEHAAVGEPFDVTAPPDVLVERLKALLGDLLG